MKRIMSDIEKGEWLQYTISLPKKATVDLTLTIATDKTAGSVSIKSGSADLVNALQLPNTGGAKNWQTVVVKNVALGKGSHALRIYIAEGGFNLRTFEIASTK